MNGFSAGYAKEITRAGVVSDFAAPGPYRTLMEGLESFAAMLRYHGDNDEMPVAYATTSDGRKYLKTDVRLIAIHVTRMGCAGRDDHRTAP